MSGKGRISRAVDASIPREDREWFVRENAVSVVREKELLIARLRKQVKGLMKANRDVRKQVKRPLEKLLDQYKYQCERLTRQATIAAPMFVADPWMVALLRALLGVEDGMALSVQAPQDESPLKTVIDQHVCIPGSPVTMLTCSIRRFKPSLLSRPVVVYHASCEVCKKVYVMLGKKSD